MTDTTASTSLSRCAVASAGGRSASTTTPWRKATDHVAPPPPGLPSLNRLKAAGAVIPNALRNAGPVRTMSAPAAWPVSALVMNHRRNRPTSATVAASARISAAAAAPWVAQRSIQQRNPAATQRLNPTAPPLKMRPSAPSRGPREAAPPTVARPPEVPAAVDQPLALGTTAPASTTEAGPTAAAAAPAGRQPAGLQCPG